MLQSTFQELRLGGLVRAANQPWFSLSWALHVLQAQAAYQKMQEDGVQPNARFYTGAQCMPPCLSLTSLTRPALLAVLCMARRQLTCCRSKLLQPCIPCRIHCLLCQQMAEYMQLRMRQIALERLFDHDMAGSLHMVRAEYLRICGRAGDLQAAQAAWQDAQRLGVHPDVILYTAMIDACAKARPSGI